MNKSNLKAFTAALANAGLSRKSALKCEIAVIFAVHLDSKQAMRLTRAVMCEMFSTCGYQSRQPGDTDWREINRRITAGIALFDFMGLEEVLSWVEGLTRGDIINAIADKIEPLNLRSTNQILEICEKVPTRKTKARAEQPGTHRIDLKHLHIVIPPSVTREELTKAAFEMLRLAEAMGTGEPEDVVASTADESSEELARST